MEAAADADDEESWLKALEEALRVPNDHRPGTAGGDENEESWLDALEQALA